MKLLVIIIDQACEPDMSEILEELGIGHWSSWTNVRGAGRTGTKEGNPIWPGLNTLYLIGLAEERVRPLVDRLVEACEAFPKRPGLKVFSLDAEALT